MKLYEIPQRSRINCDCTDGSTYIIFDHLDGMYSFCISEKGAIVHLAAAAELNLISQNVYEIVMPEK